MNLLDKNVLTDPVGFIKKMVSYTKQIGNPMAFEEVRAWLFSAYLGIDAQTGTNYAKDFATNSGMSESEQEELRYKWSEKEEEMEKRKLEFEKDPLWNSKEPNDWVIAIQEAIPGQPIEENARVIKAWKIHFRVSDFIKARFLYVTRKDIGFICKASEFNLDSYKFNGNLRLFF